jgi:hypothetical protein
MKTIRAGILVILIVIMAGSWAAAQGGTARG